jgi:two-component system, chemotaxis family, chemotaxis protein CheY
MSKVLIVDDSRAIRMILRRILLEEGYEVREARNGAEALEVMNAEPDAIRLALIDWNMPGMNGLELLKELRLHHKPYSLKVIMVTTEAEVGHMTSALEAGADEYVMKPFTKEILREKLTFIGVAPTANV